MSVQATTAVWKHSRSEGNERLVLLAIADHAHPDGTHAKPGPRTLAEMCRISERTIRTHMRKLIDELGEIVQVPGSGVGRGNYAEYEIKLPGLAAFMRKAEDASHFPDEEEKAAEVAALLRLREETPVLSRDNGEAQSAKGQDLPLSSLDPEKGKLRVGKAEGTRHKSGSSASRTKEEPNEPNEPISGDASASRPRNEIWDTLTAIFGEPKTSPLTRLRGRHVKELTVARATSDEIQRQCRLYRQRFGPDCVLTETALVKWYGLLEEPRVAPPGPRDDGVPRCVHGYPVMRDEEDGFAYSACNECEQDALAGVPS